MLRFGAVLSTLLLQASQSVALGLATGVTLAATLQAPAQAQSAEAVGRDAQAITVRIEGATQGSGVLVKREGSTYTVLTAWHVVAGHVPGEELDIETPDGKKYRLIEGSIQRIGAVDLSLIKFNSLSSYELAQIGDIESVLMGSTVYVAGFPLSSTAVPVHLLRFLNGQVIANANVAIPNGYQLLYSNPTLPGMSGGPVLASNGTLIGIHGLGEIDFRLTEQEGIAVKTGTNMAIPISYYQKSPQVGDNLFSGSSSKSADDYLVQSNFLLTEARLGRLGWEEIAPKILAFSNESIALRPSDKAYYHRALANRHLSNYVEAISDASKSIAINPLFAPAYVERGAAKEEMAKMSGWKDYLEAGLDDYDKAIEIDPYDDNALYYRGHARYDLGDYSGAESDLTRVLIISPQDIDSIIIRGDARLMLGNLRSACIDFGVAKEIDQDSYIDEFYSDFEIYSKCN